MDAWCSPAAIPGHLRAPAGPLGQCHPIPDDQGIRSEMLRAAKNYAHIYSLYNFDYDPEPGSVQWKIDQRIKRVGALSLQSAALRFEAF